MNAESFNFDPGVKNYKKNRLIVNQINLNNEILFSIEKTGKPNFVFSVIGYVNDQDNPFGFFDVLRDLSISSLDKSFNLFVNRDGNVITNVEMSDTNYFYPEITNTTNIVVCLSSFSKNEDNKDNLYETYTYQQIVTLEKLAETFTFNTKSTSFKEINVPNDLNKITNAGFSILEFLKDRSL